MAVKGLVGQSEAPLGSTECTRVVVPADPHTLRVHVSTEMCEPSLCPYAAM